MKPGSHRKARTSEVCMTRRRFMGLSTMGLSTMGLSAIDLSAIDLSAGLAGALTAQPFAIAKAQGAGAPLKVGVLLPRSGVQAGIGQDCQRGVDIAPGILKDLGLP